MSEYLIASGHMPGGSEIAQVISAGSLCVATGSLVYAIIKGTRALDDWKVQRRTDKRAEVAGQALLIVQRYLDALLGLARGLGASDPDSAPSLSMDIRWKPIMALREDFRSAERLVLTYLGDDEAILMNDVFEFKSLLLHLQSVHANQSTFPGDKNLWEAAYGEHQEERVAELRKAAFALLKPHAMMTAKAR